jgi:hypothetical protein
MGPLSIPRSPEFFHSFRGVGGISEIIFQVDLALEKTEKTVSSVKLIVPLKSMPKAGLSDPWNHLTFYQYQVFGPQLIWRSKNY